ncbi:PHD [Musa troglodytarum]|uniref:PHD n=1 Tax=Musa troglodytarum TaxID=320322 RepID=A0A9E7EN17_9LILI|nr:PHD [Musa troglodytarum]
MVCCDDCERWVHCLCDGISDEKYQQFQAEQNLQYKCAACRGDCYQVKDIDDAVRELWKRKDIADHDSIASLRAAAGLPSHEVAYSISPYSGDEQSGPIILKHDNNKPLKFSLKGISDKSSEYGNTTSNKKQVKKKGYRIKLVGKREEAYPELGKQDEARSLESSYRDQNIDEMTSFRPDGPDTLSSSTARDPNASVVKSCTNQLGTFDQSMTKEPASSNADMIPKVKIKNSKLQSLHFKECADKSANKIETTRSTKLVIHIGSINRNASSSPKSETSSCHKDQDLVNCFGMHFFLF